MLYAWTTTVSLRLSDVPPAPRVVVGGVTLSGEFSEDGSGLWIIRDPGNPVVKQYRFRQHRPGYQGEQEPTFDLGGFRHQGGTFHVDLDREAGEALASLLRALLAVAASDISAERR